MALTVRFGSNVAWRSAVQHGGAVFLAPSQQIFSGCKMPKNAQLWITGTPSRRVRRKALRVFAVLPSSSVQIATSLFTLATTLVIPLYTIMILAPRRAWTRRLIESSTPFVILGVIYSYLLALSWTPETLQLIFATKHYLPELSGITRMFSSTVTVASAWVHLLAVDLFAGRQIFLDGLDNKVETRHSLVLCLMACPIGMLCHLLTKALCCRGGKITAED